MPMGRKQKKWMSLYKALVLTVTVGATTAFAAGDPLSVINNLSTFIFSLIRAIGLILLGFGVVQVGLSLKSHDPFALWLGSCDFKDKPICTTPNPNKIKPIARIKEKIKSDKLFTTANGSPAARTGVVHHIMANTITA